MFQILEQRYKMDTQKQIENLERRIAIKKIARQYNVSERYVRYIKDGDRQPNKKSGVLVYKALRDNRLVN